MIARYIARMKTLILAMLLLSLGAANGEASKRIVSGKTYDLQPLIEWTRQGASTPKPLPQWQKLRGEIIQKQTDGTHLVKVSDKTVLVRNLPAKKPVATKPSAKDYVEGDRIDCFAMQLSVKEVNLSPTQKIRVPVYDHGIVP
jgi:hypothetical protein